MPSEETAGQRKKGAVCQCVGVVVPGGEGGGGRLGRFDDRTDKDGSHSLNGLGSSKASLCM